MKKYRIPALLLSLVLMLNLLVLPAAAIEEPELQCTHAILVDANYGEVLYDKKADEKAYPASITKVMTALLVSGDVMVKLLKLSEFQNPLTGLNFQGTGKLTTPLGANLLRTSVLPAGTAIGLDKRFALEMVQGSDVKDCLYSIVADIKSELEPDEIKIVDRLALISTVGRNMPSRPGTSGRLFGELGHAGINIRMIAQGSEELDIVVGVDVDDFERAIRVIYGAFVDSDDNIITVEEAEEEATNE